MYMDSTPKTKVISNTYFFNRTLVPIVAQKAISNAVNDQNGRTMPAIGVSPVDAEQHS